MENGNGSGSGRTLKSFGGPAAGKRDGDGGPVVTGSFGGSPLDALLRQQDDGAAPVGAPDAPMVHETGPQQMDSQAYEPQEASDVGMPEPEMAPPSNPGIAAHTFTGDENVAPCFTVVDMEMDAVAPFSREYTPTLSTTDCVAEIPMLLDYMVRLERKFGVTLPFRACGVDTIAFDNAATEREGAPRLVKVAVSVDGMGKPMEQHDAYYEKIYVDGVVYMSCISESLNPDYLHRIIAEAVDAIYVHGQYVYTLIGPRPLNGQTVSVDVGEPEGDVSTGEDTAPVDATEPTSEDGTLATLSVVDQQLFIETMKLNTYELSVFINHMNSIPGVSILYGTYDGRQAIMFKR